MKKHQIAILVSGKGTNALNIIQYFEKNCSTRVVLLVSNKMNSQAVKKARNKGIESVVFNNEWFKNSENFLNFFKSRSIDLIVLAGFLLKIPEELTIAYKKKIINIHPSLLPKFGGKGMYGDHVHEAVIRAHETESGITIHYVNEKYDDGTIIFQSKLKIKNCETVESLSKKIKKLELRYYPEIINRIVSNSL